MNNKELLLRVLTELTPSAIKLYLFMCIMGGWENTTENIKLYCNTFGLSSVQYYNARKELISKGFIEIKNKALLFSNIE